MDHDQSRPAQSTPPKRHPIPEDAWGYDEFDAAMSRTRMENEASAREIDRGLREFARQSHPNQLRDLLLYITRPQTKDKANDLEGLSPQEQILAKTWRDSFRNLEKIQQETALTYGKEQMANFFLERLGNLHTNISPSSAVLRTFYRWIESSDMAPEKASYQYRTLLPLKQAYMLSPKGDEQKKLRMKLIELL
jgi:hypothetical protein